jgi:hypothetical protein
MFVFCLIGLATGWVANRVLDEHTIRKNRELFPEERQEDPSGSGSEEKEAGEPAAG